MRNYLCAIAAVASLFSFSGPVASAKDLNPVLDWEGKYTPGTSLNALSENLFGEQIDTHKRAIHSLTSRPVKDLALSYSHFSG